ncbi:dipeptidase [soil metagenome]
MNDTQWTTYFRERQPEHLDELFAFLRIPSVSALPAHRSDMRLAAEWAAARLRSAGVPEVEVLETGGHPLVYGQWQVDINLPTAMVYAHYDVQPPDPLDLWTTPPFEPVVRDGRIFGRGAGDDKGGLLTTILAVEAFATLSGGPPINLVFFFEGEEEIGSPSVTPFVRRERDRLACDFVISADGMMWDETTPSLMVSMKGIAGCEIDLITAATDMHSGLFGGSVRNSAQAMAELAASFHDRTGRVAVKGFYDRVVDLTPADRQEIADVPFDSEAYFGAVGTKPEWGEPGYSPLERLWVRPTLDINGMWSGFQGDGSKSVTPAESHLKVTCRLVPNQQPDETVELLRAHAERFTPAGSAMTFRPMAGSALPYAVPRDHPALLAAGQTLRELFDQEPAVVRIGGSIPIAEVFKSELGAEMILYAWSLPTCNAHAPDEWYRVDDFRDGAIATCAYLEKLAGITLHEAPARG